MLNIILVSLAILIFLIYNIVSLSFFKVPTSLSNTFYLWNARKPNLGYIFTGMMFLVPLLLLPAWLNITETITWWSEYLTFLPFLGSASIMFVGAAPAFRSCKMESMVHQVSATLAAVFSLLWCIVVCYQICYIVPISLAIVTALAFITKSQKFGLTYWLEMVAFLSTFTTIFTECILSIV